MSTGTTVTRDELYRRVWSTPIFQLAKEFGISDVALAKICRKLDVPRPPRGYWQQLEHGQKPPKARLRKARAGARTDYVIEHRGPRPPRPVEEPSEPPPDVSIAENLRGAHPAAKALDAELDRRKPDADGVFYIRAERESCVRLSPAIRRRALLVLDALARGLEALGHEVTFEGAGQKELWMPCRIHAKVLGQSISLHLFEPFVRSDVVPTPEQREQIKKYGRLFGRKHVFTPSGRLIVRATGDYGAEKKWGDRKGQLVEQELGAALLGIEKLVAEVREQEAEREREEKERKRQAREPAVRAAREHYEEALALDLQSMAEAWQKARRASEFLKDLRTRIPKDERSPGLTAWLEWADGEAEALDPIAAPAEIPKVIEPALSRMADDELAYWVEWSPERGAEPIPSDVGPREGDEEEEDEDLDEGEWRDSNL